MDGERRELTRVSDTAARLSCSIERPTPHPSEPEAGLLNSYIINDKTSMFVRAV